MSEATLILPNMRGGCATVGNTVHTLFRITSRKPRAMACPVESEKTGNRDDATNDPSN